MVSGDVGGDGKMNVLGIIGMIWLCTVLVVGLLCFVTGLVGGGIGFASLGVLLMVLGAVGLKKLLNA